MRDIIKSLVLLLRENQVDPVFQDAHEKFGLEKIRLYDVQILKWLRSNLFVPRKKAIMYSDRPEWFADFSSFVQDVNELNELFRCENYSVDFRDNISFDERMGIHSYVTKNYKPKMFITER